MRRFSEDIDFSLINKEADFNLSPHLSMIQSELEGFGFDFSVEQKALKTVSAIESAFIKGNTIKNLMVIKASPKITGRIHKNKILKIKLEVDTYPPGYAEYEMKTLLTPIPFQVKIYSPSDLFAGKLHAVLCRNWKNRIKGRDYYDMIWFLGKKIPCRLDHLKARMVQTGHWDMNRVLDRNALLFELITRFRQTDFNAAKKDVSPFIRDKQELNLWNSDFFIEIIQEMRVC